jgi:hypothetical protein
MSISELEQFTTEDLTPQKLTSGQKHILRLVRKGAASDGWAPVSKAVKPLFTDTNIPCGVMPGALVQFEAVGEGGRARLTELGNDLLEAMLWL